MPLGHDMSRMQTNPGHKVLYFKTLFDNRTGIVESETGSAYESSVRHDGRVLTDDFAQLKNLAEV